MSKRGQLLPSLFSFILLSILCCVSWYFCLSFGDASSLCSPAYFFASLCTQTPPSSSSSSCFIFTLQNSTCVFFVLFLDAFVQCTLNQILLLPSLLFLLSSLNAINSDTLHHRDYTTKHCLMTLFHIFLSFGTLQISP